MKLGNFEVNVFVENTAHVDGGMMFGVVPKIIWSKSVATSPENLVAMDMNLFVIRTGQKNILVDTGLGDMLKDKQKAMYGCYTESKLIPGLAGLGMAVEDIDFVILTHLHLDHAGGTVKTDVNGKPIPRFPRATYITQKLEWESAHNPDERSQAAYDKSRFVPLHEAGQLLIVDGDHELIPGIRLVLTGGHTHGHQGVIIESEGQRLILFADIIPFAAHLRPAYVASADLFPLETIRLKKNLMPEIIKNGWYLGFDHDVDIKICKVVDTGLKLMAEKIAF